MGLGDSVTSGFGCGCRDFVSVYAQLTASRTGRAVVEHNLGASGLTTSGLRQMLRPGSAQAAQVAGADIVLVTIGANDLSTDLPAWLAGQCGLDCFSDDESALRGSVRTVLGQVAALRGGRPTEVLVTTYWDVFVDGQVALRRFGHKYAAMSDAVTRLANREICAATAGTGARCIDLYAPFKGAGERDPTALLQADGDHPNTKGHALIARTLADAGWADLPA